MPLIYECLKRMPVQSVDAGNGCLNLCVIFNHLIRLFIHVNWRTICNIYLKDVKRSERKTYHEILFEF